MNTLLASLALLIGNYSLAQKTSGDCYQSIDIVQETFGNASGPNLGIYGLPRGQGLIISQVLDINGGYKVDVDENPMAIMPWTPSINGYRPREARWDGSRLTYRQGKLSKLRNPRLHNGVVVELELKEGLLTVRSGTFTLWGDEFTDVCVYKSSH